MRRQIRREKNVEEFVLRHIGLYRAPQEAMDLAEARIQERLNLTAMVDGTAEDLGSTAHGWKFGRLALVLGAAAAAVIAVILLQMPKGVDAHATVESRNGSLSRVSGEKNGIVRLGERIEPGEILRSNTAGASVSLADKSRLELRSGAEFSVERADDGIRIHLRKGGLIVHAAKQVVGHLYVQTRDVMVSVVGTVFLVNAEEEGSRVAVIEGEVRVQQGATTKSLLPGQQMTTNPKMESQDLEKLVASIRRAEEAVEEAHVLVQSIREQQEKFDVASIRIRPVTATEGTGQRSMTPDPNSGGGPCSGSLTISPGRIVISRASLHYLVSLAYGLGGVGNIQSFNCLNATRMNLLTGGPEWMASNRFEIEAIIPEGPPAYTTKANGRGTVYSPGPRLQKLLQNLLADRFKLQLRRETKETPVYNLAAGSGGPKLKPIKDGERSTGGGLVLQPGGAALIYERGPLAQLTTRLSTALNRPVLDRTGIAGDFDFQVLFDPTTEYFNIMGYVAPAPSGQPSLFTAVEQEFGLKLEAARAPIEVWTIEHTEKPSEN